MEKIKKLRKLLIDFNLDGYIIPKNDEFFSEYVHSDKDRLRFISNFSGSFGFAVILKKDNFLFVDGRYSLQAKIQSGKFFNIITLPNGFPNQVLKKSLRIGFDPKLHTRIMISRFFKKTNFKLISIDQNLMPELSAPKKTDYKNFYVLPANAVGQNYKLKIKRLVDILIKKKIDLQFISASENVAWLLNIRGHDSEFSPITNAYLTIDKNQKINFFCDIKKLKTSFRKKFNQIKFIDIDQTNVFLSKIQHKNILIDSMTCSVFFENILKENNKINLLRDPIYYLKSIKSKIEIKNIIKSHIIDGAAVTKFLFWIKRNYLKKKVDELSAQNQLLKFRKKNKGFKFLSFPTISGSGPNGAIIHYKASKKSNRRLKKGDIYLVDSGGQYNYGTTDITRTISLNNNNQRIKNIFTAVLKGHINVSTYKLTKNSVGTEIDIVARKPLKKLKLDYPHGTGHGVGYFLNVHEGLHAISKNNKIALKEGMIVSNEPGYYENGKFGIRIENLIRVKKYKKANSFKNLTMVPIDKTLINKKFLNKSEISWLDNYHKEVFKNLKRFMGKSDLVELKKACSKI